MKKLSDREIEDIYNFVKSFHEKFLEKSGVILPSLRKSGKFTKSALTLVFLAKDYPKTRIVSKKEITEFIRKYYPDTNDVQDARHLGMQKGWYIASGTRGNSIDDLGYGEYKLVSLEEPHPNFKLHRKEIVGELNWDEIKSKYDFRCASCGSKEGEPNFRYPGTTTKLTQGHMDPNKPLTKDNTIPQCEKCNRPDRNYWIYDRKGRVIKVADPSAVAKSDESVKWKIYKMLYNDYRGKNPNDE